MPDIDRTADIEVTAAQGMLTAEIPLAGHASEDWLKLFRTLAAHRLERRVEAEDREDRSWVIVRLPAGEDQHPQSALDAVSALISVANGMEQQQSQSGAQTEAAIRDWWARQRR